MRQSRAELVKKGVLKEIPEQGKYDVCRMKRDFIKQPNRMIKLDPFSLLNILRNALMS